MARDEKSLFSPPISRPDPYTGHLTSTPDNAMGTLEKAISFKSQRFDFKSTLPDEYNAGNRFYGRDAAAYFCEQLNGKGLAADFLDEDWGWLILGSCDASTEFEIAVFNVNEHSEGGRPGAPEWGLWMRAFQRKKILGLLPKKVQVGVPFGVEAVVLDAIKQLGASPQDWSDGPGR